MAHSRTVPPSDASSSARVTSSPPATFLRDLWMSSSDSRTTLLWTFRCTWKGTESKGLTPLCCCFFFFFVFFFLFVLFCFVVSSAFFFSSFFFLRLLLRLFYCIFYILCRTNIYTKIDMLRLFGFPHVLRHLPQRSFLPSAGQHSHATPFLQHKPLHMRKHVAQQLSIWKKRCLSTCGT